MICSSSSYSTHYPSEFMCVHGVQRLSQVSIMKGLGSVYHYMDKCRVSEAKPKLLCTWVWYGTDHTCVFASHTITARLFVGCSQCLALMIFCDCLFYSILQGGGMKHAKLKCTPPLTRGTIEPSVNNGFLHKAVRACSLKCWILIVE